MAQAWPAITEEKREEIARALGAKGVTGCPCCGSSTMAVLGYNLTPVTREGLADMPAGTGVSTVLIGCTHCGYVMPFLLETLGGHP